MNFELLFREDTAELLDEVEKYSVLFGSLPLRTKSQESPHREAVDIIIRAPEITESSTPLSLYNEIQCVNYKTQEKFPKIYQHVLDVMRIENGVQLGRIIITKLPPQGRIYSHTDSGTSGDTYNRYHTVLQGSDGNIFVSGDEDVIMQTGEIWYVNNHVNHSVFNDSNSDRIHIIMDIII